MFILVSKLRSHHIHTHARAKKQWCIHYGYDNDNDNDSIENSKLSAEITCI